MGSTLTRGACFGDSAAAQPVGGLEMGGGGFIRSSLGGLCLHAHRPAAGLVEALDRGAPVGAQTARHHAMNQPLIPDALVHMRVRRHTLPPQLLINMDDVDWCSYLGNTRPALATVARKREESKMPVPTPAEIVEISREVINALNQYTDEDILPSKPIDDARKLRLLKDLGIGPILLAHISVPLTKISKNRKGRGVGVFDTQAAKTVGDCIDLVVMSL